MARIAYCWELGAGLGHLTAFLPMARLLKDRGHEVFCISKELIGTGELLEKQGFKVFQAPYWTPNIKNLPSPVNYAEILFGFGYVQEERVFEKIKAWENLLRAVGPDIVILDHAPSASLAARNLPVKRFFSWPIIKALIVCSIPKLSILRSSFLT